MEDPPAPVTLSPRKNSQTEETEPPEPSIPASGDTPTTKTNGHSEMDQKDQTIIPDTGLTNGTADKEVTDNAGDKNEDELMSDEDSNQLPAVNGKEDDLSEVDALKTPLKKKGSRSQRELKNLEIDTPKKEEPEADENAPRSRFGRVRKPKGDTPLASASKRKTVKSETSEESAVTGGVTNGTTPAKISKQKEAKTPKVKAASSTSSSSPVVTSAPQRKTVYFDSKQRIVCSRADLMKIPAKEDGADFSVGDIIWSKVTGYPFWPCLVTTDPLENRYTRLDASTEEPVYHVQYFGNETTRGWTRPKNTIAFEGLEKYKELGDPKNNSSLPSTPATGKKSRTKPTNKFAVESKHRKNWDAAVAEAEFAFKLSPQERIECFTYEYKIAPIPESKEGHKRKIQETTPVGPSKAKKTKKSQSSPEDIYDFDEVEEAEGPPALPASPFKLLSAKKKGDFNVYKQREMSRVKRDNPKLSEQELEVLLNTKWGYLSDDQKAVYVDRTKDSPTTTPEKPSSEPLKISMSPRVKTVQPKTPASLRAKPLARNSTSSAKKSVASSTVASSTVSSSTVTEVDMKTPAKRESVASRKVSPTKKQVGGQPSGGRKTPHAPSQPKRQNSSDQESQASESVESSEVWDETTSQSDAASETDAESQKIPPDEICYHCFERIEAAVESISCSGVCLRTFHSKCVTVPESSSEYKCQECTSGNHKCFICDKTSYEATSSLSEEEKPTSEAPLTPMKCSDSSCGRFYHQQCLTSSYPYKQVSSPESKESFQFLCPLHFCLTCHNDQQEDNIYRSVKCKVLTCVKCPTAYHLLNDCIAAGSTIIVPNKYIWCPEHLEKQKKKDPKRDKLNVPFCFACMKPGKLLCCERCPAAFHTECLEFPVPEDVDSFFCPSCIKRKQLRYGEIVWLKIGRYRWWPGKILLPHNIPDNIMKMDWKRGQFAVVFFGSNDYNWLDRTRVFPYEEGDALKPLSSVGSSKTDQLFKKGLVEAKEAYLQYLKEKDAGLQKKAKRWPPYKHIRTNRPVGNVQIINPVPARSASNGDEPLNMCECDPASEAPCSSDEDCLNRLMMIECSSKTCKAGDKCCNQRFKKREYVRTKPFNTGSRGWGLKTLDNIKKGQFVIEYVGELISEEECNRRLDEKVKNNDTNFYFLTIDKDCIIDAGPAGNLARFMNHSCQPNCATHKWVVNGAVRIGLFAVCDIPAGTELTFNYNLDVRGSEKTNCGCGAKNCSKFIGVQPKKEAKPLATASSATPRGQKKGKNGKTTERKRDRPTKAVLQEFEAMHEDVCFTCGGDGQLIMCDRKGCPKSYDLACLGRETIPRGRWECPWHHCDECGKNSVQFCSQCPSSFCSDHKSDEFKTQEDGKLACPLHESSPLETPAKEKEKEEPEETKEEEEEETGNNMEVTE